MNKVSRINKVKFSDLSEGARFQGTFGKTVLPLVYQKVKPVQRTCCWGSYELNTIYASGRFPGRHCYTFPNEMVVLTEGEDRDD